ncbi:MAG: glycosyltransferase [Oligoflexales bacterium]|nr:glycosyltransferase [Oligoflexales bacterium]
MAPENEFSPKISIITATYNAENFIDNLIVSLKSQTCANWEWIVVDDGSNDGTFARLKHEMEKDERIKVFQKDHEGIPALSRNVGIEKASSELLAFCDHDDFWVPEKLEIQISAFRKFPKASIVHTERVIWQNKHLPEKWPFIRWDNSNFKLQPISKCLLRECKITSSSTMIPRHLMKKIGGFNPASTGVDDYHAYIKLAFLGDIVSINLPLTYYYWHEGNLSHVKDIFAKGLTAMADELEKESIPPYVVRSIKAQALKRWGVVWLDKNPIRASKFFLRSAINSPSFKTILLMKLALIFSFLPVSLRTRLRVSLQNTFRPLKSLE